MTEFLFGFLLEALLRSSLGILLGFPTFCGTFVYRLIQGVSLPAALKSATEIGGQVFAECFIR